MSLRIRRKRAAGQSGILTWGAGWPRARAAPDARTDFLTTDAAIYAGSADFRRDLSAALDAEPRGQRDAIVFVRGFNTTFAEGL